MKRKLMILAVLAVLTMPLAVWADDEGDTTIPPQMSWTPYPPASKTVDGVQLAELLREKGVITDQDYARLTLPQLSTPSPHGNGRVWTWDEIDNDPLRNMDGGE